MFTEYTGDSKRYQWCFLHIQLIETHETMLFLAISLLPLQHFMYFVIRSHRLSLSSLTLISPTIKNIYVNEWTIRGVEIPLIWVEAFVNVNNGTCSSQYLSIKACLLAVNMLNLPLK